MQKESTVPELIVQPDQFLVSLTDVVLQARLEATFVLCIYDAVEETGGMVHLRSNSPGRAPTTELTDTTLSSDLLLIDRCIESLRNATPRAQHWQGRFLAHTATSQHPFQAIREILADLLQDAGVRTVSSQVLDGAASTVRFRPFMGEITITP